YLPDQYFRVDANLAVDSTGSPVYAKLGRQNSLWVALLEKAWTVAKDMTNSAALSNDPNYAAYGMLDGSGGGGPQALWTALNIPSFGRSGTASTLSDWLAGMNVCVTTTSGPVSSALVSSHWYFVENITCINSLGLTIPISYTLRNPWGG